MECQSGARTQMLSPRRGPGCFLVMQLCCSSLTLGALGIFCPFTPPHPLAPSQIPWLLMISLAPQVGLFRLSLVSPRVSSCCLISFLNNCSWIYHFDSLLIQYKGIWKWYGGGANFVFDFIKKKKTSPLAILVFSLDHALDLKKPYPICSSCRNNNLNNLNNHTGHLALLCGTSHGSVPVAGASALRCSSNNRSTSREQTSAKAEQSPTYMLFHTKRGFPSSSDLHTFFFKYCLWRYD